MSEVIHELCEILSALMDLRWHWLFTMLSPLLGFYLGPVLASKECSRAKLLGAFGRAIYCWGLWVLPLFFLITSKSGAFLYCIWFGAFVFIAAGLEGERVKAGASLLGWLLGVLVLILPGVLRESFREQTLLRQAVELSSGLAVARELGDEILEQELVLTSVKVRNWAQSTLEGYDHKREYFQVSVLFYDSFKEELDELERRYKNKQASCIRLRSPVGRLLYDYESNRYYTRLERVLSLEILER